jgi:hypothetical protein
LLCASHLADFSGGFVFSSAFQSTTDIGRASPKDISASFVSTEFTHRLAPPADSGMMFSRTPQPAGL